MLARRIDNVPQGNKTPQQEEFKFAIVTSNKTTNTFYRRMQVQGWRIQQQLSVLKASCSSMAMSRRLVLLPDWLLRSARLCSLGRTTARKQITKTTAAAAAAAAAVAAAASNTYFELLSLSQGVSCSTSHFKGEVHPKMKVSYLVEFGTLSRMVKVRGVLGILAM